MRTIRWLSALLAASALAGCGTIRGSLDAIEHLGAGIVQDARGVATGIDEANVDSIRAGRYHE